MKSLPLTKIAFKHKKEPSKYTTLPLMAKMIFEPVSNSFEQSAKQSLPCATTGVTEQLYLKGLSLTLLKSFKLPVLHHLTKRLCNFTIQWNSNALERTKRIRTTLKNHSKACLNMPRMFTMSCMVMAYGNTNLIIRSSLVLPSYTGKTGAGIVKSKVAT